MTFLRLLGAPGWLTTSHAELICQRTGRFRTVSGVNWTVASVTEPKNPLINGRLGILQIMDSWMSVWLQKALVSWSQAKLYCGIQDVVYGPPFEIPAVPFSLN